MEGDCTQNPEDWNNGSINESAGRLLRAAMQHRKNNSDNQSK